MQGWVIVIVAIAYVSLLFAIARIADKRTEKHGSNSSRPYIYALSLAIYCTSWTFFGSVGFAAERGFEFLAIYIGPILVFLFGYPLLRRMVRLAKSENITSSADFLAARYGKSFAVAAIATLIATIGYVPYIALQLKAISGTVSLMVEHYNGYPPSIDFFISDIALLVALLLALFAILFGTRHADATEHQDGLILAVAVESIVKLFAFLAVGFAVTFIYFGGPQDLIATAMANPQVMAAYSYPTSIGTWIVLTMLSGIAILMLPRQFHVTIVENRSDKELRTATWLFPLYLVAINLFVLPVAYAGIVLVGDQTHADLYVLSLPLMHGQDLLAMFAFIGGLSAATAMVIVACVALSIMISNDLVMPLLVRLRINRSDARNSEDWSQVILNVRRAAIFLVLLAAFLYYRGTTGNTRLAAIGLISFAAIAQFAPAFFGGLIWRGANSRGAVMGLASGIVVWFYTLLFPSIAPLDHPILVNGLFGLEALRPQSLFGTEADPLNHGVLWSLAINSIFFVLGSLSRSSAPLERIQAALFVPREASPMPNLRRFRTAVTVNEIKDTISRYLGVERTERSFESFARREGRALIGNEQASAPVIRFSEQLLASAVGTSSARLILSLLFQRKDTSSREAYRLLDDASEALQQNRDLLQTALDQMEEGVTVFDRDYRLTCWNRQFRALFDLPDEMGQVGVSLHHVFSYLAERGDLPRGSETELLNRMTWFGEVWSMELHGSGHIIEVRSNPMPGGGIVATYTDITARVEADLALKRANETLEQRVASRTAELLRVNEELAQAQMLAEEANLGKTRFLAAAGHDILQPLNAARLYCSTLLERADIPAIREPAINIESSLESVETILGAVLDISRLDTGALTPTDTTFRLDGLLRQIQNDFLPQAIAKDLQLRIVPSSLAVETDRNLLRRLVQNLVSNAIKYTRSGRILIGVRRRGELVEIQVHDTGIGIDPDKLNSVFREFTRLEEGMREAQGLGLGLSIVDRIARVLRLELRVRSVKGSGSCFSVLMPRTEAAGLPQTSEIRRDPHVGERPEGVAVICIDNDARILEGMRSLLEGWGCDVRGAAGSAGIEALAASGFQPDLALVDYHLDDENGIEVIKKLRAAFGPDLPAALVTADRTTELREAARELDVPVVNKPVKPAVLRTMLSRYRKLMSAAE
ncbi:MAG: NahK/ErcS family hybrid sensor histidine kinase/response regulator [Aliihoeflea sp.]